MTDTQHYQLNQWAADDQVLRTDFNADNAKIDAALGAVKGCNCQLYFQAYTGNGENGPVVHEFPYRPMAVIIMNPSTSTRMFSMRGAEKIIGSTAGGIDVDTGITWADRSISIGSEKTIPMYCGNVSGTVYWIVAFLDVHDF